MLLPTRNTPRWLVFIIDLSLCLVSLMFAYLVRFEFAVPRDDWNLALKFIPVYLLVRSVSFYLGKTYAGIIRYTSSQDSVRIFFVFSIGTASFFLLNFVSYFINNETFLAPSSVLIIEYLISLFALLIFRLSVKQLYTAANTTTADRKKAIIFGAGEGGIILKRTLDKDARSAFQVVAFVDDDEHKVGKKLEGTNIYSSKQLDHLLAQGEVQELFIAVPDISVQRKRDLADLALKHKVSLKHMPHAQRWINGELSAGQLRQVQFEDLLGRDVIRLNSSGVEQFIKNQVVLVTGAAGSIGSELVRQALMNGAKQVIACDIAETPMFILGNELADTIRSKQLELVIGDVKNEFRMKRMFEAFHPQIVLHAAAYKHVPLMEENPAEAVATNVLGTNTLLEVAMEFGVKTFVMVSTDKAVNPTNVMGASKRIAELVVQSKGNENMRCVTTRFGNVLGSNGSVIPVFRKQIEAGGPVTVTHPEIRRFFMTIPEAVQLVLEAGAMCEGNDLFAFDMGEQVLIAQLAEQMIRLSGLEPGTDIQIEFTGLRPGEKLYEEVLSQGEDLMPTHHHKILKAKNRDIHREEIDRGLADLRAAVEMQQNKVLVGIMKHLVPEFKSNNSEFEALDQ
jgi:FlaA1/EpsC-like NDP-sugar epimerase